ncbi:SRPBCC family protein [Amycolatopsis sp. NPDC059027]|uniref:SRPBCC family protein n=1 Tax=unclassified Amycolatopsis TaxID=2618356 RepID=UPI00366DF77A
MTPTPTGRLLRTADGCDLVLERTFRAPIDDVWASVTEPESTARWFGAWKGDAAPGRTVQVQMAFEEGAPWFELRIDACEPPRRLAVSTVDENGSWRLELLLTVTEGACVLRLVQHLESDAGIGDIGPGWEYYLDQLVASGVDGPLPAFTDYHPGQKAYYEALAGR